LTFYLELPLYKKIQMNKQRLEIFSDGVLAIIITIMVLEINGQVDGEFSDLVLLFPAFTSYVLSFIYV